MKIGTSQPCEYLGLSQNYIAPRLSSELPIHVDQHTNSATRMDQGTTWSVFFSNQLSRSRRSNRFLPPSNSLSARLATDSISVARGIELARHELPRGQRRQSRDDQPSASTNCRSCELTNVVSAWINDPERAHRNERTSAVVVTAAAHWQCPELPPKSQETWPLAGVLLDSPSG